MSRITAESALRIHEARCNSSNPYTRAAALAMVEKLRRFIAAH